MIVAVGTPAAYLLATREFRGARRGADPDRAAADPAAGGRRHRAAGRARAAGHPRARRSTDLGIELPLTTAARGGRARVRREPVLRAPGAGRVRERSTATWSRRRARWARPRRARSRAWRCRSRCPSLGTGLALAWGRALGEFGATLMFAGSFRGVTQTAPLAIYESFSTDFTAALALSAVLVAVSGAILLVVKLLAGRELGRTCSRLSAQRRRCATSTLDVDARGRARAASRSPAPRAPARRRSCASAPASCGPAARPGRVRRRRLARHRARRLGRARASAPAASCSRTTRCSRTCRAWQNVAYGMRGTCRGASAARARRAAARALRRRATSPTRTRARSRAGSASGWRSRGRSRAAPRVLLLDEPLAALDARTRAAAARELAPRCARPAVPALLVTHDFAEAAQLGDEVAVDRPRPGVQRGPAARARRRARRPPSSRTSPAPASCRATRGPAAGGLTAVRLDGGGEIVSTDHGRRAAPPPACSPGR